MLSSEANCMQFLYDLKILRTNHQCPRCCVPMALQECPATKYREGCCWKCKCGKTITPRVGSNLENSHVTYEEFIKILAERESVSTWKPCKGHSSEILQQDIFILCILLTVFNWLECPAQQLEAYICIIFILIVLLCKFN